MQEDTSNLDLEALSQLLDEDTFDEIPQNSSQTDGDKYISTTNANSQMPSVSGSCVVSSVTEATNRSKEEIEAELEAMQKRMAILQNQLKKNVSSISEPKQSMKLPPLKTNIMMHGTNDKYNGQINGTANANIKQKKLQLKDIGIDTVLTSNLENNSNAHVPLNKIEKSLLHLADIDSSDDEYLSAEGRKIQKRLAHNPKYTENKTAKIVSTWKVTKTPNVPQKPTGVIKEQDKNVETDFYSGIRIVNPLVSSQTMKERMTGRKMVKMSVIRCHMRGGDIEGDWVTVGVIIEKTSPKSSKTGKTFSIWKMSDLRDTTKFVNLFLFGEVYNQHWKAAIGSVVGVLNPSIMPDRGNSKYEMISLSVDHPGKLMMMGKAKDFGYCKGRKKNGQPCSMVVNLSQCEYCEYHVKAEYKKMSSKRVELQASYSGMEPNRLRNKLLNEGPVIYGGQQYGIIPPAPRSKQTQKSKDQLTLDNLKLKRKAENLENELKESNIKKVAHLTENENQAIHNIASHSESLGEMLVTPGAGSRNLLHHLVKDEHQKEKKGNFKSISPKALLKMHEEHLKASQKCRLPNAKSQQLSLSSYLNSNSSHKSTSPQLGKGCKPGDYVCFDISSNSPKAALSAAEVAKLRAIEKIRKKGPLHHENPNAIKKDSKCPDVQERVRKRLKIDVKEEGENSSVSQDSVIKSSKLGKIDVKSEKFQKILERKSSHAYEVEEEEFLKQEKYFHVLEKKEQMEMKMESISEIACEVVSCKQCRYTAHQPSDLCKNENHSLKRHKAIKRFFRCKECSCRTVVFAKLPTKVCRNCGAFNYEKTTMKASSGPKLATEKLLIRGEERKFINS